MQAEIIMWSVWKWYMYCINVCVCVCWVSELGYHSTLFSNHLIVVLMIGLPPQLLGVAPEEAIHLDVRPCSNTHTHVRAHHIPLLIQPLLHYVM